MNTNVKERITRKKPGVTALNLSYLYELSGGDHDFVAEIIEMFLQDAPDLINQSNEHIQKEDYHQLRVTVHKLKSSVKVLGGDRLALLIQEIENNARKCMALETIPTLLQNLEDGIVDMMNQLSVELKMIKE